MEHQKRIILIIVFLFTLFLSSCSFLGKTRKLEITYKVETMQGFVPSRQTVVWLEKPDGKFIKTLFVSDYTAYGGYLVPGICPDWVSRADWKNVGREEFDAVTGATPPEGKVSLKLECPKEKIPDGEYILCMEIHLNEEYNVLCKGEIHVSSKKYETGMKIEYVPEKYPKLKSDYISDVKVICK